ncbi:MAG: rod shape-determining protein RodA [Spirochaetaceae bacterium]|jgi:rod shape determining protein RodA|nr:rod shape-determining protein RodA [Spirochaetaceae bacterium]
MKLHDFFEMDYALLFSAVLLTVFGVLFIYSSSVTSLGASVSNEYIRQIFWGAGGLVIAIVIAMLNYRRIYYVSSYLYLGSIVLLIYTCLFGRVVNGARAWLGIASFGIQPSEFAKITTIIFLARFLDSTKNSRNDAWRFVVSCMIVFAPMMIILIQPDFGTSLVFIAILLSMTFIAGISSRYIIFLLMTIALSGLLLVLPLWQTHILGKNIPFLSMLSNKNFIIIAISALLMIFFLAIIGFIRYKKTYFYWIGYSAVIIILSFIISYCGQKVLKPYQIMRLIVFLDPDIDPRGSGWNIIQSITAIGSGGILGKGYLQGTQSHYRFLPQQSTDFIFSIYSEEWGFLGGVIVFLLFLLISLRLIKTMKTTSDSFGCYIVAGLAGMYIFHFMINVGMTMGIMPITGIPLLFMSYGGSALITAMAGIGLALSVHIRRFQY